MFTELPRIDECIEMGEPTEASLTHQKVFHSIMLIMLHPKFRNKTLIRLFDDKSFDHKQDIVLDINIETYYAIVSVDRRSQQDQDTNRFIVLGLRRPGGSNKLVKLNFIENECDSEDILYSKDLVEERLSSCHTV